MSTLPLDPSTGPAFVSGVIASTHAILAAVRSGDRSLARTFHQFEAGSAQEAAFDEGCQFAATKMLGGGRSLRCRCAVRASLPIRQPTNQSMNSNVKTCLLGFTLGVTLFSPLWIIPLLINKPEQLPPASPPPTTPLVVYSHRPWLLEGNGTNSLASFLFTTHEWETLCATLGPVASDGTLKLPQGSIRRLSPDSFTNLMESLGREAVRTGQVWISTGGGR